MFEYRIKNYQQSYIALAAQKFHEEFAVNLRKSKRYNIEKKKRLCYISETSWLLPACISNNLAQTEVLSDSEKLSLIKSSLMNSPSKNMIIENLLFLKFLVSSDTPPLDLIVSSNLIQQVVLYLNFEWELDIILEATSILCHMVSDSSLCIENMCENNCIKAFLRVLDCKSTLIKENALWGLSNIIAHSQNHFELVVENGLIKKLSKICKFEDTSVLYHTISWILENIANYIDNLNPYQVLQLVRIGSKLIASGDYETVKYTLSAIGFISRQSQENNELLYEYDIVSLILKHICEFPILVLTICGNICRGTSIQICGLLERNLLDLIYPYFPCDNYEVIQNLYWILGNIVIVGVPLISKVMNHPVFKISIMHISHLDESCRINAGYYVCNLMKLGTEDMKMCVIEIGIDKILNSFCQDICRIAQNNVLEICEYTLELIGAQEFLSRGCKDALYSLSSSKDKLIKERAIHMIEKYIEFE